MKLNLEDAQGGPVRFVRVDSERRAAGSTFRWTPVTLWVRTYTTQAHKLRQSDAHSVFPTYVPCGSEHASVSMWRTQVPSEQVPGYRSTGARAEGNCGASGAELRCELVGLDRLV